MQFLHAPPPYLFFTGKDGVGKASLACAAEVALADRGRRVLIVSTDPASNRMQCWKPSRATRHVRSSRSRGCWRSTSTRGRPPRSTVRPPSRPIARPHRPSSSPCCRSGCRAHALQEDLRRASIEPFAWVINASLAAAHPRDPLLVQRAFAELDEIRGVGDMLAQRFAVVPFLAEDPVGAVRLQQLARIG